MTEQPDGTIVKDRVFGCLPSISSVSATALWWQSTSLSCGRT